MTEIKIVREDEKATAILKAIRQIDDGEELAPVKHGQWVQKPQMYRHPNAKNYYCSECREETAACGNYCPCCGARMDKEEDHAGTGTV